VFTHLSFIADEKDVANDDTFVSLQNLNDVIKAPVKLKNIEVLRVRGKLFSG